MPCRFPILLRHVLLAGALLLLSGFRMPEEVRAREPLLYDVRAVIFTAAADVSAALATEAAQLVEAEIAGTHRAVPLPRVIITVRIEKRLQAPDALVARQGVEVFLNAIAIPHGEIIAEGSFDEWITAKGSPRADAALARRIASRIARAFRLGEDGRASAALSFLR